MIDVLLFSWANNVWFGIGTLTSIFIYSSIGSALPPVRQHPWFDMTEMEWFHWWPFDLLIVVLCVNMIVVTLKQIPLRWINAGVWTIHTGIITLALGSMYYFGTKLEGDVPVFRRRVVIRVPGQAEEATLVVRPNNQVRVGSGEDAHHFTVSQIFPDWKIASGADQGKSAFMAWIEVVTPTQKFTRQLLAGFPQYTEDILPDRTRAVKTLGRQLVDDTVALSLDYEPQTEFYLMDSAAMFLRPVGAKTWVQRPIQGLPRYHEHLASPDQVYQVPGDEPLPLRPINVSVPATDPKDPLADVDLHITSYLRYAHMVTRWRDGGDRLYPYARLTLSSGPDASVDYELVAFDPQRNSTENGKIVFRWVDSPAAVDRLVASPRASLTFKSPAVEGGITVSLDALGNALGETAEFRPIEGTDLAFRVKNVVRNLLTQSAEQPGELMSVAAVEIKTPQRTLTRFVADLPGRSRDVADDGRMLPPDPVVDVSFDPGVDALLTVLTGSGGVGTWALLRQEDGTLQKVAVPPRESVAVRGKVRLTIRDLFLNGVEDTRPQVVPLAQRERDARELFSMIRVDLAGKSWREQHWLEFNRYAFTSEEYAIPRRLAYNPTRLALPDGRQVEFMFSRERRPLPAPIALETFELATHAGGYTGVTTTIRDFISLLRFKTPSGWTDPVTMSSNNPASMGGYWYFQSQWDPPGQGYAGMNYTGLGVGNRNGVHVQLVGCCIAVSGMIFAFYVKPIIRRRKQEAAKARRSEWQDLPWDDGERAGERAEMARTA